MRIRPAFLKMTACFSRIDERERFGRVVVEVDLFGGWLGFASL